MKWTRRKTFWLALLSPVLIFVMTASAIVLDGLSDCTPPVDVVVVLGNTVEQGRPSARLQARLDRAVELYRQDLCRRVLVSGGIEPDGQDEAQVMRQYLVAQGVPQERILVDREGDTTRLTARNAAAIMRERNLQSALVVSQYFHISRTKLALRHYGVRCEGSAHAKYVEFRDGYSTLREVVAFYAYLCRFAFSE